jgi:hypothetical protein
VDAEGSISNALQLAAYSLKVDRVSAEVVSALDAASIPSILLKGPGIATWLYSGDQPRLYGDSDLLLRKGDWAGAMGVLAGLGFSDGLGPLEHPRMESGAGYPWERAADGAGVDLHYTLFGIGAEPEALWAALSDGAVVERVGGAAVALPSRAARLLHIALHAVQHGSEDWGKPIRDLERALAKAPRQTWVEALELAERLDAPETFATGLRLTPPGRELAAEIGAAQGHSVDTALRLNWVPLAEGFRELSEARGIRRKAALALREVFPTPAFMRWWSPLARRGAAGLALSYCWRPLWLAYHAVPGFLAWRRARRQGR